MSGKKKFVLPDTPSRTITDIENETEKVLAGKADYFAGGRSQSTNKLSLDVIVRNPEQPRKNFDRKKLNELKDSMAANGLIEPIMVRPIEGDKYEIVCGERRYRAAKELGWNEIEVTIRNISTIEAFELALVENLQRDNLHPIEQAEAFKYLLDKGAIKDQKELAEKLGLSQTAISFKMSLLSLPSSVKKYLLTQNNLVESRFRKVHSLSTEEEMLDVAKKIVEEDLNVTDTEKLISQMQNLSGGDKGHGARTITNPLKIFKKLDNRRGIWFKHDGKKLIIEAKGVVIGKEQEDSVKRAMDALYNTLFVG